MALTNKQNRNYKEQSQINWVCQDGSVKVFDQIQTGALQRIADATEKMAQSYTDLQKEHDRWKQRAINSEADYERMKANFERRISAINGVITRMKNKGIQKVTIDKNKNEKS